MKYDLADCVQRGHQFAIVDEVDSILIDEARTPLIISGPAEESTDKYYRIDKIIPKLIQEIDYTVDEKHSTATLTEEGVSKAERLLGLGNMYDPQHMETIHHVYQGFARTRSTSATSITSSKTAKSSSSTNSPAAKCPAAAGPTACTRPSKPRKASRSSAKTRPWPPSPSRIISACTRSFPA